MEKEQNEPIIKNNGLPSEESNLINNFSIHKDIIEAEFGNKKIPIEIFPVRGSRKIVINIHGTHGSIHGGDNKYFTLAKRLQENNICNCVLFETARKNRDETITDSREMKKKRFEGKNFNQELQDCQKVIEYVLENSEKLFEIKKEDIEISINGNSLGGIIGLILAQTYPQIKNISAVGSGLRTEPKQMPILDTFPPIEELRHYYSEFKGNFLLHYGTEDSVFSQESFKNLLQELKKANVSSVKVIGVDHTFKNLNKSPSKLPYKQVYNDLVALVGGDLVGGEVILSERDKDLNGDLGFFI